MEKKHDRDIAKQFRIRLSDAQKSRRDARIFEIVCRLPAIERADQIFLYASGTLEVDTWRLIDWLLAAGKPVALPRSLPRGEMVFHRVLTASALKTGFAGILEPAPDAPVMRPSAASVLLVPALAIDHTGSRLGWGGGYYDRYCKKAAGLKYGLCYAENIYDTLPCGAWDVRLDGYVTQDGFFSVAQAG